MRLIDADALKLAVVEEGQRSRRYKIGQTWELNRSEIWTVIDSMPTIEERKPGYLICPNPYGKCSECGQLIDIREDYKYCPNCGCKIEGR